MVKALIFLQMETHFQAYMSMENQKEKECISGNVKAYTLENSKMEWNTVREIGERNKTIQNAIDLKENINSIWKMDLEHSLGKVVIFIMVITLMTNVWAMEKCIGLTDLFIKVNGSKVYNMEEVLWHFQMEE
jgi:hypothetical protein